MTRGRIAFWLVAFVGVGAGTWLLLGTRDAAAPGGTDGALVVAARDLASARSDLFGGFVPLGAGERRAARPASGRGIVLMRPTGTILGLRPSFTWEPVSGARSVEVTLRTEDGAVVWKETSATGSLPFPDSAPSLDPGKRYVWEVLAKSHAGGAGSGGAPSDVVDAKRPFAVASAEERSRYAEAGALIDARVPPKFRALVKSHWAARHELFEEALGTAEEAAAAAPSEDVARETLAFVRRRLGIAGEG